MPEIPASSNTTETITYALDAARSRFQIRATATGLLSSFGHNPVIAVRSFSGEVRFPLEAPEQATLRVRIDPASLTIAGDVNEKDRSEMERAMKDDVLEVQHYPAITFESSNNQANQITGGMYRAQVGGKLSIHGVTRELVIPSNVTIGADSMRANGEFSIRQTDFGIRLVSAAGGTIKLKDELKITFDIAANRKPEEGH